MEGYNNMPPSHMVSKMYNVFETSNTISLPIHVLVIWSVNWVMHTSTLNWLLPSGSASTSYNRSSKISLSISDPDLRSGKVPYIAVLM